MTKLFYLFTLLFIVNLTFTACSESENEEPAAIITLNRSTLELLIDETFTLIATVTLSGVNNEDIMWTSSNPAVATVADGIVTALSTGTVTIIAAIEDGYFTATCVVEVIATRPVTNVRLDRNNTVIGIGGNETLTAIVSPANATNQNVTWTSSNTEVATVNTNGVVTAISVGNATITVATEDGNFTATCVVEVVIRPVTGVTLNRNTIVSIGNDVTIIAAISPANATNRNVTWTSSNTEVATINANGVVTALSVGNTIITVTTEDGNFTATSTVRVIPENAILINGVAWATRNVNAPGTFAENPESIGMFFQWNRRQGWAATGNVTDWDYSTPTGSEWERANDPCPSGWRVPTREELTSLRDAGHVWRALNGVNGRFFGTAPNQIFLPAAGSRSYSDGERLHAGTWGNYWSSTRSGNAYAWVMDFTSGRSPVGSSTRRWGFSVRCVAED